METTRRRFALMSACLASRPTFSMRVRRRISARVSSSSPASAASRALGGLKTGLDLHGQIDLFGGGQQVDLADLLLRYIRTGSPVSITVEASIPRTRERERDVRTVRFFLLLEEPISASA